MRVPALLLLVTSIAIFMAGCGGPEDPVGELSAACERQRDEVKEEESGTPEAKSTSERLDSTVLVECSGQNVRLTDGDATAEGEQPAEVEGSEDEGMKDAAPAEDVGGDAPAAGDSAPAKLDPAARELYISSCGACHVLSDAGTMGAVGPNLDETEMDATEIEYQIINGAGAMPAGLLEGEEATSVAEYVAAAAAAG